MSFNNSRYVAEIDLPEGYISIDCEIEFGGDSIDFLVRETTAPTFRGPN